MSWYTWSSILSAIDRGMPEAAECASGVGSSKVGVVSGVPKWGRSSKRRVLLIRWTRREIMSAAGLVCLISFLILMLALWLAGHPFD